MDTVFLPSYTMKKDACDSFQTIIGTNKRVAVFYGEKAWKASEKSVVSGMQAAAFTVVVSACYGGEATYEHVEQLLSLVKDQQIDLFLAIGGGKCIDTVKAVADRLNKPVYTVASIASTCAAVTKISIMYHADGSFKDILALKKPPVHCFIDPTIILEAPVKYLWAGIGDTMAKHVESAFSARNDQLDYASELGVKIGENCFYPMLRDGCQALQDARQKQGSDAFLRTILNILITTGSVSLAVHPDYNSALAHAMFYGLTVRKHIEQQHLHGEVVSYGTLVQLMMDQQVTLLETLLRFHKQIGLPTCLQDLQLSLDEDLQDILLAAEANKELLHVPYPVTRDRIYQAICDLEAYQKEGNI